MKPFHLIPLVNVPQVNGNEAAEPGQSQPQLLNLLEHWRRRWRALSALRAESGR